MNSRQIRRLGLLLGAGFVTVSFSVVSMDAPKAKAETSEKVAPVKASDTAAFVRAKVREGKLAYRRKDYAAALEAWLKGLEADPHNKELSQLVNLVKEKVQPAGDRKPAAMPSYKQRAFVTSQVKAAKKSYRKKNYVAAYRELKDALDVDPRNAEANRLMSAVLEKQPDVQQLAEPMEVQAPAEPAGRPVAPAPMMPPGADSEEEWEGPAVIEEDAEPVMGAEQFRQEYAVPEQLPLEGVPITLEQCIMIARANSLSVKIAREEAALARWKMAPARRALWPSFDALWKETRGTTTGQDFEGREITLEVQKPLITWGKTKALYLQAKVNWEIAKRNLQKEVTELDFKVEQAYFILANALKDVQDLHALYKESKRDMETAEKRYKLELARELEYLKVKSKVDEVYYRVQAAEKDLILSQLTLAQILDSRKEDPFTVRARLGTYELDTTLEQCVDLALANRSDLSVNELLIEYNKLGQKVAKSEYKWNVNLEGSVGVNDEAFISESIDLQEEYFVGVKVTKPFGPHTFEDNFLTQDKVPSVGQTTSTEFTSNTVKWYFWNSTAKINIKEADIKFLKAIDEYIKKRNSIIFEIKKNYYEYLKAKQQLTNNKQKIKVAEEELKVSIARFGLNEILDSELLESKDRVSRAKSEYGQSLTGYYTAVANLNKSIGLTDYFDLKRGLQEQRGAAGDPWRDYINAPGDVGSIPRTEGYKEIVERLEGKKGSSWWGLGRKEKKDKPSTTEDLVENTTDEGIALYKEGKYDEALKKFETAQQLDPEDGRVKSYIRKTRSKLGLETDEAGKKFDFSAKASHTEEWLDKGIKAYNEKRYEESVDYLNKVLESDPGNRRARVYLERAQSKLKSGKTQM